MQPLPRPAPPSVPLQAPSGFRAALLRGGAGFVVAGLALAPCLAQAQASATAGKAAAAKPVAPAPSASPLPLADPIVDGPSAAPMPAADAQTATFGRPSLGPSPGMAAGSAGLGPAGANTMAKDRTPIAFESDQVEYNDNTQTVVASGNVYLHRTDRSLRADTVTYHRDTGRIVAHGNIRMVDENGNQLYTDEVELTDEFKTGAMQNMLLALREGGRLAANGGQRLADGTILLGKAAYTGCDVVDETGCDLKPSWHITARRVIYDPDRKTVRFSGARLVLFGARLVPLPSLVIATDGRAVSGLLIPGFRVSSSNGVEVSETWYQRLGDNRDISATAYVFSKVAPMGSFQYRQETASGAFQVTGYATTSPAIAAGSTTGTQTQEFRGYLESNGMWQFSPGWSASYSGRIVTDRTFLARYFISSDDVLRSTAQVTHVDANSWFSVTGWAFQTMRSGESQGLVPIALPEIDYRRRFTGPGLGGVITLQGNTLAITRTDGQDTQRAFASGQWDIRRTTGMGQLITLTGLVRGDIYHSSNNALTSTAIYQGAPGWQTRGVVLGAVDVQWPLIGRFLGGTQVLTPHFQIVASPSTKNLAIPNEDSRAIELEDDNLFALNRFPGYDRVEDGTRFTYGLDWQLDRPGWKVTGSIGQSYRLTSQPTLLPDGTGLSDRLSDIVGRIDIKYHDFVKVTERFRLDKDTGAIRRQEADVSIGSEKTYVEVGYTRLNRQIAAAIEDLQDSNELRAAGRVAFARYWSMFGSAIFDLSNANFPVGVTPSSFQPLRTRLGIDYKSNCLELGVTWRRDYVTIGDAVRGNSFQIHVAFKNLGLR